MRAHGLGNGDIVKVRASGQAVPIPVRSIHGLAPDCAVAFLGFGRTSAGAVGNGVGVDVTDLRGADAGVELIPTGERAPIASTDHHNMMDVERTLIDDIVRHVTLAAFTANPGIGHKRGVEPRIYQPAPSPGVAWGMPRRVQPRRQCAALLLLRDKA